MCTLTNIRDRVTGLQLQFLERFFVVLAAKELDDWYVVIATQFDKDFLPKPLQKGIVKGICKFI